MWPCSKVPLGPKAISTVWLWSLASGLKSRSSGVICTILNQISGSVRLARRIGDRGHLGTIEGVESTPVGFDARAHWCRDDAAPAVSASIRHAVCACRAWPTSRYRADHRLTNRAVALYCILLSY